MRLIDADAIVFTHAIVRSIDDGHNWNELCVTKDEIDDMPSAKPERTAKVISDDVIITVNGYRYHYEEYLCNACKKKVFSCDSYCSHCGAKLDWSWIE